MNIEEIQQQLAEIRGEATAGRVLGATGIYLMLKTRPKDEWPTILDALASRVDVDLNAMTFVNGDTVLNEKVREIARLRAQQDIDSLRVFHQPKGK